MLFFLIIEINSSSAKKRKASTTKIDKKFTKMRDRRDQSFIKSVR